LFIWDETVVTVSAASFRDYMSYGGECFAAVPPAEFSDARRFVPLQGGLPFTLPVALPLHFRAAAAEAAQNMTQCGFLGGHTYYCSKTGVFKTWPEARAACQGIGAYLVSITSAAENAYVGSLIGQDVMIGLSNLNGVNPPWAGYWESGEPFAYENWSPGEPGYGDASTTGWGMLFMGDAQGVGEMWGDIGTAAACGFVCEKN
jgi:hypothetical protein